MLCWKNFVGTPNAVLFADGLILAGGGRAGPAALKLRDHRPSLRLLAVPNDPLVASSISALNAAGVNAFFDSVPAAVISLFQQGFGGGRLIPLSVKRSAACLALAGHRPPF